MNATTQLKMYLLLVIKNYKIYSPSTLGGLKIIIIYGNC